MADGVSADKKERKKSLKDDARPSRRHMIAIWAALATALGGQGIPAIVELLSNKPNTEDVQVMIAKQTAKLTVQQNTAVEAIKNLGSSVKELRAMSDDVSHVKGLVDVLRDVVRDCCTRRLVRNRLEEKLKPAAAKALPHRLVVESVKKTPKKNPIDQLQKVPEFNPKNMKSMIQQQAQVQELME